MVTGEVITLKEVAEFLKVHERTVYRLAAKGDIPAFKVANSWRFRREDIERWIDQQTRSPAPADKKDQGEKGDDQA